MCLSELDRVLKAEIVVFTRKQKKCDYSTELDNFGFNYHDNGDAHPNWYQGEGGS